MKKVNKIINIIMAAFVGVFIGHDIFKIWDVKNRPELYAMQSAPWYLSILVDGIFMLLLLVICILIKIVIRYLSKKSDEKTKE